MTSEKLLYLVDDDPLMHMVICGAVEPLGHLECYGSVEECHQHILASPPDLLLLDISLPGMDGYSYCRQLKADPQTRDIPVLFISSLDTLEERIAGYDAGAEDFLVKPVEPAELLRKVQVSLQVHEEKHRLKSQMAEAEALTSMVLASMDETGVVLQFMSKLIGWDNEADIAQDFLELLHSYRLDGAVQTRVGERSHTVGETGPNRSLEISIINHVRSMGRIFEFRNRAGYNYDRVTILINNMPLDDPNLCGRLRDNLAIAAQGADARLAAIETSEARRRSQSALMTTLKSLQGTLSEFQEIHRNDRRRSSELAFEIERDLQKSFVHLGLSVNQERYLEERLNGSIAELLEMADHGLTVEKTIARTLEELEGLLVS